MGLGLPLITFSSTDLWGNFAPLLPFCFCVSYMWECLPHLNPSLLTEHTVGPCAFFDQ